MRTQTSILIAGLAIALALSGAGCPRPAPKAKPLATNPTTSSNSTSTIPRVAVPELNFSYVPYTTDTSVYGGVKLSGSRLMFGSDTDNFRSYDFIESVPPKAGATIEDRMQTFLKDSGGSLDKCRIETASSTGGVWDWLSAGLETVVFVPKKAYKPTNQEVLDYLRVTSYPHATNQELDKLCSTSPECDFAKQDLIEKENRRQCGLYAVDEHYQVVSMFIADPAKSQTILYIHTTGGGGRPVFDGGPIKFLP